MYKHDCTDCIYLGEFDGNDLYFCKQGHFPTVIARFGDEPEEYTSGLVLVEYVPELKEAKKRALKHGLIKE